MPFQPDTQAGGFQPDTPKGGFQPDDPYAQQEAARVAGNAGTSNIDKLKAIIGLPSAYKQPQVVEGSAPLAMPAAAIPKIASAMTTANQYPLVSAGLQGLLGAGQGAMQKPADETDQTGIQWKERAAQAYKQGGASAALGLAGNAAAAGAKLVGGALAGAPASATNTYSESGGVKLPEGNEYSPQSTPDKLAAMTDKDVNGLAYDKLQAAKKELFQAGAPDREEAALATVGTNIKVNPADLKGTAGESELTRMINAQGQPKPQTGTVTVEPAPSGDTTSNYDRLQEELFARPGRKMVPSNQTMKRNDVVAGLTSETPQNPLPQDWQSQNEALANPKPLPPQPGGKPYSSTYQALPPRQADTQTFDIPPQERDGVSLTGPQAQRLKQITQKAAFDRQASTPYGTRYDVASDVDAQAAGKLNKALQGATQGKTDKMLAGMSPEDQARLAPQQADYAGSNAQTSSDAEYQNWIDKLTNDKPARVFGRSESLGAKPVNDVLDYLKERAPVAGGDLSDTADQYAAGKAFNKPSQIQLSTNGPAKAMSMPLARALTKSAPYLKGAAPVLNGDTQDNGIDPALAKLLFGR